MLRVKSGHNISPDDRPPKPIRCTRLYQRVPHTAREERMSLRIIKASKSSNYVSIRKRRTCHSRVQRKSTRMGKTKDGGAHDWKSCHNPSSLQHKYISYPPVLQAHTWLGKRVIRHIGSRRIWFNLHLACWQLTESTTCSGRGGLK